MTNAPKGKAAGNAEKPAAAKNAAAKPKFDTAAAKPSGSMSPKLAAKDAPTGPAKKAAGDGSAAKPASDSSPSTAATHGPVTAKSAPASPTMNIVAASAAANLQPSSPVVVTVAPAKVADCGAGAATAVEAKPPASSPAAKAADTDAAAARGEPTTTAATVRPTVADAADTAKPKPVAAAAASEADSVADGDGVADAGVGSSVVEDPGASDALPKAAATIAASALPALPAPPPAGEPAVATDPATAAARNPDQLALSSDQHAAVQMANDDDAATAAAAVAAPAAAARSPDVTTATTPSTAAAAVAVATDPQLTTTQAAPADELDCIAVKPVTTSPSVKKTPSFKVLSEHSKQHADYEASPSSPPARRTGSAAWMEHPIVPEPAEPAEAAVASAPVLRFDSNVSRKSLATPPAPSTPPSVQSPAPPAPPSGTQSPPTGPPSRGAAAGCVVVTLEGNPGGPCPVELAMSVLDPGNSGEVMVADLMTTAMKALRAKYGAVQAGGAVNAFLDAPGQPRRWLPTFDTFPSKLLTAAAAAAAAGSCSGGDSGRASVVLQGLTCGEAAAATATATAMAAGPHPSGAAAVAVSPAFPLPGLADASESGNSAPLPNSSRVTFTSENGTSPGGAALVPMRSLLRGASRGGGGGGGRILGAGHRSVRIRLEENTVETLSLESAEPSSNSLHMQVRGSRLPPLRTDSDASRTSGDDGGGGGAENKTGPSPFRGRLGATRSSRRLLVPLSDMAAESVESSDFDRVERRSPPHPPPRVPPPAINEDPVQVLKTTENVGRTNWGASAEAAAASDDGGGGGGGGGAVAAAAAADRASPLVTAWPSVRTAKDRTSNTGAAEGATAAGAVLSGAGKKSALTVRPEADLVSGEDLEAAFFPAPPADWIRLMGQWDDVNALESSRSGGGGCMPCFSAASKTAQQRQWRQRLRAALDADNESEVASWVAFHCGRNGTQNQDELDAALWLAVEARAPDVVRVLLRGGARPDAPRPIGQLGGGGTNRTTVGLTSGAWGMHSARVKDSSLAAVAPPPPLPSMWQGTAVLEGLTPLMRAAELASPPIVEALLVGGADALAAQPATGWTAVHRAVLATPHSHPAWASRTLTPIVAAAGAPMGAGSGASRSSSGSATAAAAGKAAGKAAGGGSAAAVGPTEPGGGIVDGAGDAAAAAAALHCLRLLVSRIGLQRIAALTIANRHGDNLLRFAVRHGRLAALKWLLSAGLSADGANGSGGYGDDDEASCAFLAGQLGLTVEVWDMPPPPTRTSSSASPLRDPARPLSWLFSPEERLFVDRRRQLLMGAAAGGRIEVLAAILDKPPPFDRLRRDELEAAIGACRLSQPRNQRQVEELLARKAQIYMPWEREVVPALRRFDTAVIGEWLMRDRPMPVEVDKALATLLSSERLGSPLWQDNATASLRALLDAGADVEYEWDVDPASAAAPLNAATCGVTTLRPLQSALLASAPAIVRQLLAAGADPRRRGAEGENALFFAVRVATTAATTVRECDMVRPVRQQPDNVGRSNSASVSEAAAAEDAAAAADCIELLLGTECAAELLAARNDKGLNPAILAALADLPGVLTKLCAAGADPWVTPIPAVPGAPDVPRDLLPSAPLTSAAGKRPPVAAAAATGLWSVGHETARMGALSALSVLLGVSAAVAGRKAPLAAANAEQAAARRRDALVGAIRGGRVGAAKLALDADGIGGSLYEAELAAALALCKASAAAPPLPPPAGAGGLVAAIADPPRYDTLAAFLSSRAHVYMSWDGEVLPAIRAANLGVVRRWIAYDKVSAADATRALCALVEAAQQCNISGVAAAAADEGAVNAAAAASSPPGGAGALSRLLNVSATPGKPAADVAAELVKAGADVNFQQEPSIGGLSLLMQVAVKGHLPLLEVLLSLGARVDAEDAAGLTALDHAVLVRARLADNGCLAALLVACGARRLNAHRTHAGDSALMLAVRTGDSTAAQLLLAAGATPAAADASAPARIGSMTTAAAAAIGSVGAASGSLHYNTSTGGGGGREAATATVSVSSALPPRPPQLPRSLPSDSSLTGAHGGSGGGRTLGTFSSGLGRRGSAVYLAARMDDKAMLQQLLRNAGADEGGMESCRQEVQLGALHGGRLTLLEASLGLPELLKSVAGPAEGVGAVVLGGAAAVCGRLSEQAAVRLAEAQSLAQELEAAAAAAVAAAAHPDAAAADATPLVTASQVPRLRRYLAAKSGALEALQAAHSRMGEFFGVVRLHVEALEGALEAKKELVSSTIRDGSDAQVKLMAATTRLTASKDSVLRSVLARRDAQLARVDTLLDKKLAGLNAAQRRAEAKVTSEVEGIIMEMRKLVGKRLKEIDAKKQEGLGRIGALEHKLDAVWGRRQRLLAGRPPALRAALSQQMGALLQQLGTRRETLNEAVAAAVAKMEGGQRRGTALVSMEALRGALGRMQQDMARSACEAAAIAKAAVAQRAEELLRNDKHDQLLRIVSQMQAEVTRGAASIAATSAKTLAALQQAHAVAMGDLDRRVAQARARMQEHLTALVGSHTELVKALGAVGDDPTQLAPLDDAQLLLLQPASPPPPDVAKLLLGFEGASALDAVEGVPRPGSVTAGGPGGGGGGSSSRDGSSEGLEEGVLRRVGAVEEMIEDMIQDMAVQVLHAFPSDGICDTLPASDVAALMEPDSEISTSGLGIERLRQDIAAIDFGLPNLDLEIGDLDLSALDDGGTRAFTAGGGVGGMGMGGYGMEDEEDGVGVGVGVVQYAGGGGGGGGRGRPSCSTDDGDTEPGGRGRYHAADYGDRHEDDFALSYS